MSEVRPTPPPADGGRIPALRRTPLNPFGLHAMPGGVWEWTAEGALRGGSWRTPHDALDAATRREAPPGFAADDAGFRVARSLRTS